MEVLNVNIKIGNYTFDFVESILIESSWKNLTDTCKISLPSKLKFDKGTLRDSIKKGDVVTVQAGYAPILETVFSGFVTRVQPSTPVVIECEDLMWKLKQIEINDVLKNETLNSFLKRNLPDIELDCFDITLPKFVASRITASRLLDEIKRDYDLFSFIRNGKLTIGKQYTSADKKTHTCTLNYDILDDELEYQSKDDIKFKVIGIANLDNGEKIEIELGDPNGEVRTRNFAHLERSELEKLTTQEFERLSYDGWIGGFTWFGYALVSHGDVISLKDAVDSDKPGDYFVDKVSYEYSVSKGIKQTIELGSKI